MKILVIILSVILAAILIRWIIVIYHKSMLHTVTHRNKIIKSFLETDVEMAQLYLNRSKLSHFKIVDADNILSKRMLRSYYKEQKKALESFRNCFKSYCARAIIEQEGINIETLMTKEKTCLGHRFCSPNCVNYYECQGLMSTWGPFFIFWASVFYFLMPKSV